VVNDKALKTSDHEKEFAPKKFNQQPRYCALPAENQINISIISLISLHKNGPQKRNDAEIIPLLERAARIRDLFTSRLSARRADSLGSLISYKMTSFSFCKYHSISPVKNLLNPPAFVVFFHSLLETGKRRVLFTAK
jgi:hypothetical protein